MRLVLYVLTVVHSSASSKYISVVLCVFLMPVTIFFQKPPIFPFCEKHPHFRSKKPRSSSALFAKFPTEELASGTASFTAPQIAKSPYSFGVHRKWELSLKSYFQNLKMRFLKIVSDRLFFGFSVSILDLRDSMTSDSFIFLDGSTSGGVIRQFSYFTLNILCQIFEVFYNNSTIYRHCF